MIIIKTNPEKQEKRNIFFTGNVVLKGTMTILVNKDYDNYFQGTVLENKMPYAEEKTGKILNFSKNDTYQFYGNVIIESL